MQRPASSYRASEDHVIDITQQQSHVKQSPRITETETFNRPSLCNRYCRSVGRRGIWRFRFREKWIHAIPLVVFLCTFVLWWFSYPVNLEIKDGRLIKAHRIKLPEHLNHARVDLTILMTATPPDTSIPLVQPPDNESAAQPASPPG